MFKLTVVLSILSAAFAATLYDPNADWRIVGGKPANEGDFPFIVSLQVNRAHNCGGSIIGSRFILTAGHCVYGASASKYIVVAGSNKLSEGGDSYKCKRITAHENYPTTGYDIGIIELEEEIKFSKNVQPIDLEELTVAGGEPLTLAGWGRLGASGAVPDNLQNLNLTSLSVTDCKQQVGNTNENEICTLTQYGEGACFGDSGGPLVHYENTPKVCGIVSRGYPCALGRPDIFTRVSAHLDWIKKQMA